MTDASQPRETSRILVIFSHYTKSVVLQALASRLTLENAMIARPKQKNLNSSVTELREKLHEY